MMKEKSSGVLMHISSLPSEYGIGTMGVEARKFVDFLEAAGQSYWQMLPICPPVTEIPLISLSLLTQEICILLILICCVSRDCCSRKNIRSGTGEMIRSRWIMERSMRAGIRCFEKRQNDLLSRYRKAMRHSAGITHTGLMTMLCLWR